MTIDVCILAGGYGSRLRDIWDGPKCLVPVAGKPILERLLKKISVIKPNTVIILLGHKHEDVTLFLDGTDFSFQILPLIMKPEGTTVALKKALPLLLTHPFLLLNGDTLPLYDLTQFVRSARIIDRTIVAAWCRDVYAGASVFTAEGVDKFTPNSDINTIIDKHAVRYQVSAFLDVGTPENFHKAQHMKEEHL